MIFLVPLLYHRYDDHGVGEYYGIIRGRFIGDDPETCLEVNAESSRAWRWAPPHTYVYDSLNLTVFNADGNELQGRLSVPDMVFDTQRNTEPMTQKSFATLFLGTDVSAENAKTANEVFEMFRTAGTGEFPPPRHHSYSIGNDETRIAGNVGHWSMGKRVPHLLVYWVAVWLIALLARVTRIAKKSGDEPSDAPESPSRAI
jgi:hypothetical protein